MATAYLSPGVYVEEVDRGSKPIEGVGTAVAAFIGFAEQGPVGKPTLVTNWSQFTNTFGGFFEGGYLAPSIYGYFTNGGTVAYVTRLPGEVNGHSANTKAVQPRLASPTASLPSRAQGGPPSLDVTALEPGAAEISVEVRPADEGSPEEQFTVVVRGGGNEEVFSNVTLGRGRSNRNVVETVNRESKLVKVAERDVQGTLVERAPAVGTYALAKPADAAMAAPSVGKELALPETSSADFIGEAADRTGILGYEVADNVTMVCVPDLMAAYRAGRISAENVKAVQIAMLNHCEAMRDRVAILDCPPDLSPQEIREWRVITTNYDSKYGALYYPWLQVANPLGGDPIIVPPSGHMAGIWARNDTERGVHKAPANEVVRGAIGLATQISRNEQDTLNPVGINCIRAFPGRGIRVWGARTLSSDPSWRYLNVRRLFNFVEKSIENGTQWVVFEPNDFYLWEKVKRDVSAFLTRVWRDGALFGAAPEDAFYVKCDEELNPVEVRDVGQMIVEIAIAPVKPAEFVIFRIAQYAGGPAQ
jgi:Bacteriophage tail sheath protein